MVLQTCTLFENLKPPRQQLFTAAAALYFATGLPKYRGEADYLWDAAFATFIYNWNNVAAQVRSSPKTTLILRRFNFPEAVSLGFCLGFPAGFAQPLGCFGSRCSPYLIEWVEVARE